MQPNIQRGATYLQEVFHRLIQNFRNRIGATVCTGSCAIYRRSALEPFGGAYPVERSEDVNTGLSVLRTGWEIQYLPLNLATGLSPDTIKSFFHQQYRWCSGSLHLISSSLFWSQNITILQKLSYFLSILYYLTSGLGTIFYSFPSLINVWFYPDDFKLTNYSFIFPALTFCLALRGLWSVNKYGVHVLFTSFVGSYSHLTAILDVIRGDVKPWIPTGNTNIELKKDNFKLFKNLVLIVPTINVYLFVLGLWFNREIIDIRIYNLIAILSWYSIQLWMQYFTIKTIMKEEIN